MWTPAVLAELPDDVHRRRVEIVNGVLAVSPQPASRHTWVVDILLARAVTQQHHATNSFGIEFGRTYRVPDLAVIRRTVFGNRRSNLAPSDVVLALEVESPSSITTDRITKPTEYAAGGIPHYWRVELDPLLLPVYRLAGDACELAGSWGAGETARITDAFAVEIELGTRLPDRRHGVTTQCRARTYYKITIDSWLMNQRWSSGRAGRHGCGR